MTAVDDIVESIGRLDRKDLTDLRKTIEKRLLGGGGPEAAGDRQAIDPQPPTLSGSARSGGVR